MRKILIIMCLLGIAFGTNAQKKRKNKKQATQETTIVNYKDPGAQLPAFKIVTKDNMVYTDKDFKKNLLVMTFNPTCEHCIDMGVLLSENLSLFKNTDIVMVAAPNMKSYLDNFLGFSNVGRHPSIIVGLDSAGFIDKTFKYETLPQLNFYDNNKKLIRVFTGDQSLDTLKPYIK